MSEEFNPDFGVHYKQDMVFRNYKENLLHMIEHRQLESKLRVGDIGMYPVTTINATEGGALHGPGVKGMRFADVLDKYGRN
jgi:hypothetical protein